MNQKLASILRSRGIVFMLALFSFCQSLIAADYYISPTGNDSNGGTVGSPVATFERARDLVRTQIAGGMTENITVHIGAGNYYIENAVVFDDRDSGRNGFTITYQGAPNLGSCIYGGRRITGWTKVSDTEYRATVSDLQSHFTLYENDEAANGGLFHQFNGETKGNWSRNGTSLTYYPRNLPIENQVVVLGTTKDVFIVKGRTNQQIVRGLVFDGLHMIGSDFTTSWPGGVTDFPLWTGTYDGKPVNTALGVIFPEARHGQFFVENAQNIVIRNSKLYGAGFMAVFFHRWAQNNRVENCWIENAGASGIFFQGWEPGRGGSEGITTLAASYCNKFNVVRNNVFHDIGRFQNDAGAVYLCWSGDNTIEHNVIKGVTRYGISSKGWRTHMINNLYYWVYNPRPDGKDGQLFAYDQAHITYYDGYVVTEANQGAELNHSRNNVIRYNDISQIGRYGYDYGMIEAWGSGYDNIWAYNACHDGVHVTAWDNAWLNALYVDDGSHRTTIEGNIVYWFAGGAMTSGIVSKGNNQINRHNIVADCLLNWPVSLGPYVEQAYNATWSNNIVSSQFSSPVNVTSSTALNGSNPTVGTAVNNVYYRQTLDRDSGGGGTITAPSGSISADPQFDRQNPWWDAHYTDYKLKSSSPALPLGFQETDTSLIGVRNDYPFNVTEILGQSAGEIRLAANYSRLLNVRIYNSQIHARSSYDTNIVPLPANSWARYDDIDFDAGQFEQFVVRLKRSSGSTNQGPVVQVRLNAPDGPIIGTVPYAQNTCRITPTTGRHDVFLVFPNGNVDSVDWFVFNPRAIWTGNGADSKWSSLTNWSIAPNASAPIYFGPSSRLTPINDFSSGSSYAGLVFDSNASAYTLSGNSVNLTGDIVNLSANHQTIQIPLVLSSTGPLRVDTGTAGMTLSGNISGASSGICTELIKSGTGSLTLSGNFSFKGNVSIEGGKLIAMQAGFEDTASVSMNTLSGAVLDLRHGFSERVTKLYFNGVRMPDGTYGSTASAASYKDDSVFRGKGMLVVQGGPTPPMISTRGDGFTVATFIGAGSGEWTVPAGVSNVEVLVVGGGGGGSRLSGGGGAGGLYHSSSYSVTPGAVIPITVGAGGAAGSGTGNGGNGGLSQFGTQLIAYGGLRGLDSNTANGGNQGGYSLNGGTTVVPGRAPGEPRAAGYWSGSGAGAAGTMGGSAAGGIGMAYNISGQSLFYAGGGGSNTGGLGGSSIGGNGATAANTANATAGVPHTGSGGGGGNNGTSRNGGGSGIIVVAYQANAVTPTTTVLVSSGNPSTNGQSVTFTATVKANNVTATNATGNYIFTLNGANVATVPIVNGSASYTTNTLAPGPHFIAAIYNGDHQYGNSAASLTQTNNSSYTPAVPVITTRGDGRTIAKFSNTSLAYWQVPQGIDKVEIMLLGGGGSGASGSNFNADGGGAGGLTYLSSYKVVPGRLLPVVAGAGGAARTSTFGNGFDGSPSYFDVPTLTALGGEAGQSQRGGNAGMINLDGVTTPGGLGGTHSLANGGGGLGQDGGGAYDYNPGGNGIQFGITGSMIYYGGGGGGNYGGAGGLGGGGKGSLLANGTGGPGTDGLGGGGGAGRDNPNSGKGGDGVVILVYSDVASIWTVSYESNGGSAIPSQTVGGGNTATPPASPTKSGYLFGGWFSDAGLTSLFNFSNPITANTTLYAKWLVMRTVSFESNGGSAVTSETVGNGTLISTPISPTRPGFLFAGWYSDSGLTTLFNLDTPITSNITLYAKWDIIRNFVWTPTAAGTAYNWNNALSQNNWTFGFPNDIGDIGNFNINLVGAQTISLNQAITVGAIHIGDTVGSTYSATTIDANGGSLIMDAMIGNATISKATSGNNVTDTIAADILLNDDIVVHNAATSGMLTISGILSGNGRSLEKTGAGTLRFSKANTYTGDTTISAGTLQLGSGSTGGNGSVAGNVINNATLHFNNADALSFDGDISGSGSLIKSAAGNVTLGSGAYSMSNLTLGNAAAGGTITLGSESSFTIGNGAGNNLYIGSTGGGVLDASAAAEFTANVVNFRVGYDSSSQSTVSLGVSSSITASTSLLVGYDTGTASPSRGTITVASGGISTIYTPLMVVGGNQKVAIGQFNLLGTNARLNLSGLGEARTSLIIGQNIATSGTIARTVSGSMDLSTGIANLKLSKLVVGEQTGTTGPYTGNGSLLLSSNPTNHLDISGPGTVVTLGYNKGSVSSLNANGTLTIGNLNEDSEITSTDNSTAILIGYEEVAAAVTNGTLNLNGGALKITTTGTAIAGGGGNSILNLDGGASLVAGASSTDWINGLTKAEIKSGGATIHTNGFDLGISQAFSGAGSLTKAGLGTLTLSGVNTYSGATNVNVGTLVIDGANTATTGALTVSNGARLGGNGTTPAAVTLQNGGKLLASISDWTGSAGTGFADLQVGSLAITDTWTLDVSSIASYANFSEENKTFAILTAPGGITGFDAENVTIVAETFPGVGAWTVQKNGNTLELVYTAGSGSVDRYVAWELTYPGVDLSDKNADFDGDGLSNFNEFAFGLNPTNGASNSPISNISDLKTSSTFSYTRPVDSDLIYTVWTSTDLQDWGVTPASVTEVPGAVLNGIQTVLIELNSPPSGGKVFVRVKASK